MMQHVFDNENLVLDLENVVVDIVVVAVVDDVMLVASCRNCYLGHVLESFEHSVVVLAVVVDDDVVVAAVDIVVAVAVCDVGTWWSGCSVQLKE
jgi:hypothetical protein